MNVKFIDTSVMLNLLEVPEMCKDAEETPAIGTIMIWSTDTHLQGYRIENVSMTRIRRK